MKTQLVFLEHESSYKKPVHESWMTAFARTLAQTFNLTNRRRWLLFGVIAVALLASSPLLLKGFGYLWASIPDGLGN